MIRVEELGQRYYNLKRRAEGGNVMEHFTEDRRRQYSETMSNSLRNSDYFADHLVRLHNSMRGKPLSTEHKAKIGAKSKVHRRGVKLSDKHKSNIGAGLRGKKHTESRKRNVSEGLKRSEKVKMRAERQRGVKRPDEVGRRVSEGLKKSEKVKLNAEARRGTKLPDDTKSKISATLSGVPHTDVRRANIKEAMLRYYAEKRRA